MIEYTTNQKGLITEMQVMLFFIQQGYNVSQPLNSDSKYDCILDVNNRLYKIQIKTAHKAPRTADAIEIKCRSVTMTQNHRKECKYTPEEIDFFATVWEQKVYLIPVEQCSAAKTLHLIDSSKRQCNWSYLNDYRAEEVLKTL